MSLSNSENSSKAIICPKCKQELPEDNMLGVYMEKEYTTSEHIVAFIDILGASEKIKQSSKESLNTVHFVYEESLRKAEIIYSAEEVMGLKPIIKIWSDNIVVAVPVIIGNYLNALFSILVLSTVIQSEFLAHNYLVRGGISVGDFFSDDVMTWGNSLVNSYKLENGVAIYPRIVIHSTVLEKANIIDKDIKRTKRDFDGMLYVDYLQGSDFKTNDGFVDLISCFLKSCNEQLELHSNNEKLKQKLYWHQRYLSEKLFLYCND